METGNYSSMRKLKNMGHKGLLTKRLERMKNGLKIKLGQRDIDAAHTLVELANDDSGLLEGGVCSHGMKHSMKGMPSDSKVGGRKINFSVRHQQPAFEDQMKDEESVERKQKKGKIGNILSSLRLKCMKNNVNEKADEFEAFLEDCHDKLIRLKTRKRKREAGSFLKRETVPVLEKLQLKMPLKLAVPTVHTGFSFSVIHLLTAVRIAMVAPHSVDDALVYGKDQGENNAERVNGFYSVKNKCISDCALTNSMELPFLTLKKIVEHVRSNPMDSCILLTQEPLRDIVRGVLKIFTSKTAPLGAKGWKPLTFYYKSSKSWSWIGPITLNSCNADEEDLSSAAWGLDHKMLVRLVDSFAIWFKSFQERFCQVASLPAPPLVLMQPAVDERERLRGVGSRKSVTTINPIPEEVRAYFHKEEALRYLVPDRAFAYTALDGRKSAVAPLRRCSGKPSYRHRDHFMLKADRPAHITILCLVRDAAARLPGSIGTRADISTLIRDSQYVVDDVSDDQLNQVVSGALDRLHYESDPCVKYDGDRKLWVYLHGEREEEDFEDDGTLSTVRRQTLRGRNNLFMGQHSKMDRKKLAQ